MQSKATVASALAAGFFLAGTTTESRASDSLTAVSTEETFVSLLEGRELSRLGIRLTVTPDGQIVGSAFGTEVTGQWSWDAGYFCRDLFYGERDLGYNCQLVQIDGNRMRFTSDQGAGQFADFTLR